MSTASYSRRSVPQSSKGEFEEESKEQTSSFYSSPPSRDVVAFALASKSAASLRSNKAHPIFFSDSILHKSNASNSTSSPLPSNEHLNKSESASTKVTMPALTVQTFSGSKLRAASLSGHPSLAVLLPAPESLPHKIVGRELEPKVMVPFFPRDRSQPPRRVAVERKKREFAGRAISSLLLEHGIDYTKHAPNFDHKTGLPSFLPLQMFDDREFDCHSSSEWLALASSSAAIPSTSSSSLSASSATIEAQALRLDAEGHGEYQPCTVHFYDEHLDLWTIKFHDSGVKTSMHRLMLCFSSEDPLAYTRRVAFAHLSRRLAETRLRRSLYIDLMPNDEMRSVDSELVNRVLFLALNTKKLRLSSGDTSSIVQEVHLDYARACNEITFDALHQQQNSELETDERALQMLKTGNAINFSTRVPEHNFAQNFSDFCFHSFLTKSEAISAMINVNSECLKLEQASLFVSHYNKIVRLEEFQQTQLNAVHGLSNQIRDKLLPNLAQAIKSSLKHIDKGWLNLNEQKREIYDYSKLKRMMLLVNLMVAASVRATVERGASKYAVMIQSFCDCTVSISSKKVVHTTFATHTPSASSSTTSSSSVSGKSHDAESASTWNRSLFAVDILFKDGAIVYSTAPEELIAQPLSLFECAFTELDHLPQIESLTLPQLFPLNYAYLATIHGEEPHMKAHSQAISAALTQALFPMHEYLELYTPYLQLLSLNVDELIKDFNRVHDGDLEAMRFELTSQIARRNESELTIPRFVCLGLVQINVEDLKRKVLNKHNDIISKQLELLARWCRARCDEIIKQANKIEGDMRAMPIDIPALIKLKEWLTGVPSLVHLLRAQITEALTYFDVLEQFAYRSSKDLAKLRWTIFSTPKTLLECLAAREQALSNDTAAFLAEMKAEQDECHGEVHDTEKRLSALSHVHDVDNLERLNEKVETLQATLNGIVARTKLFNANEALLGVPLTDYRHLHTMEVALESNYLLFTTAFQWQNAHQRWRTLAFHELQANEIESSVREFIAKLDKVADSKVLRESTAHATLLLVLRRDIALFEPALPLVMALRNEGMRPRHWKMLANELPFDIDMDDESLTLTRLLDEFGLLQYLESITAISLLANQEFVIEKALLSMEESWRGREFTLVEHRDGTFLVRDVHGVLMLLGEHREITSKMLESPHKAVFLDAINKWHAKLAMCTNTIHLWMDVQNLWLEMEPYFTKGTAENLASALPVEAKKFASVSKSWRLVMAQAHSNPDVLTFADSSALLSKMTESRQHITAIKMKVDALTNKSPQTTIETPLPAASESASSMIEPVTATPSTDASVADIGNSLASADVGELQSTAVATLSEPSSAEQHAEVEAEILDEKASEEVVASLLSDEEIQATIAHSLRAAFGDAAADSPASTNPADVTTPTPQQVAEPIMSSGTLPLPSASDSS